MRVDSKRWMWGIAALAVIALSLPRPALAQWEHAADTEGLTIYGQGVALVRASLDQELEPGERTVRIEGLPTGIQADSLLLLNPEVTLLGTRGYRTYQGAEGSGASMLLDLEIAGAVDRLELAYLTGGLSWSASYSMIVAPDDSSARVDGHASLENGSGASYRETLVQLLAGQIDLQASPRALRDEMRFRAAESVAAAPQMQGEGFAGYRLYTLSDPLTLAAGDTRRIRLAGGRNVPVSREVVSFGSPGWRQRVAEPQPQSATLRYRLPREGDTELARTALPAGPVRVYQPDDDGRLQLLGVAAIDHSPAGQELVLPVGEAFDITVTRIQTAFDRRADDVFESAWRLELANATDEAVEVQVIERVDGDWKVLEASHEAERLSAAAVRFIVSVPAEGSAEVEYRVRVER